MPISSSASQPLIFLWTMCGRNWSEGAFSGQLACQQSTSPLICCCGILVLYKCLLLLSLQLFCIFLTQIQLQRNKQYELANSDNLFGKIDEEITIVARVTEHHEQRMIKMKTIGSWIFPFEFRSNKLKHKEPKRNRKQVEVASSKHSMGSVPPWLASTKPHMQVARSCTINMHICKLWADNLLIVHPY